MVVAAGSAAAGGGSAAVVAGFQYFGNVDNVCFLCRHSSGLDQFSKCRRTDGTRPDVLICDNLCVYVALEDCVTSSQAYYNR